MTGAILRRGGRLAAGVLFAALAWKAGLVAAQPVTDQFIAGAEVVAKGGCALLRVNFHVRLRYAGHFPLERGDELRITLYGFDRDISNLIRLSRREGVRVEHASLAAISAVTVDLDQAGGPLLRIQFQRPVSYKVAQIGDLDNILIVISTKGSVARCNFADFGIRGATRDGSPPSTGPARGITSMRAKEKGSTKPTEKDVKVIEASMDEARAAIKKNNFSDAIQLLRKVLKFSENKDSAEAQELLGVALQKSGQTAQARAEYEDYLRRYRSGDGNERVRQRLAGILTAAGSEPEKLRLGQDQATEAQRKLKSKHSDETQWSVSGSLSSFFYSDDSNTTVKDISTAPNPNADPDSHRVHQNTLLSNFDVFGTATSDQMKSKFKLSAVQEHRFDPDRDNYGISTAFFETTLKPSDLMFRVGRQSRNSGGVIGRFDGGLVSWQANDNVRLNVVGGSPNWSRFDRPFKDGKYLFGASVDFAKVADGLDTTLFAIQQNDGSLIDRQAVGAEFRYFDKNKSAFGTIDYDIYFQRLNAAILSGSWTFADMSIATAALDYRRVPYLSSWNALQGQPFLTLYDMLKVNTADEIRQFAIDRTPVFESAMVSYSRPLNEKLQVSGDATVTYLSGTAPSGGVDGTQASGTEYYLSAQLIGSSIIKPGDMFVGAVRYANLANSNVYVFDLNTRYPVTNTFRVSPRLRLGYRTGKSTDLRETTILPSVLMNYTWSKDVGIEAEVGTKLTTSQELGTESKSTDLFMTLGVRYDFYTDGRGKCGTTFVACSWFAGPRPAGNESSGIKSGSAPAMASSFVTEAGLRYWYSSARNSYGYFADASADLLVSRLAYADLAAHSGELFLRIDGTNGPLENVFLKGYVGGGKLSGGKLIDEDFPPIVDPYSQTVSDTKGKLLYGAVDLGYSLFKSDRVRFGAFVGYHYWSETVDARGCRQTGGNPDICSSEIPTSVTVIKEKDRWNTIRLGGVVDVNLTDRLRWNGEAAFALTAQRALDTHYFTFGDAPASGRGTGFQAESTLSYQLTDNATIGIGGRWWHFKTEAIDSFGQLLKYSTDRYGAFVQGSYRF